MRPLLIGSLRRFSHAARANDAAVPSPGIVPKVSSPQKCRYPAISTGVMLQVLRGSGWGGSILSVFGPGRARPGSRENRFNGETIQPLLGCWNSGDRQDEDLDWIASRSSQEKSDVGSSTGSRGNRFSRAVARMSMVFWRIRVADAHCHISPCRPPSRHSD